MSGLRKYVGESLANRIICLPLPLRTSCRFFESQADILDTADKAIPGNDSSSEVSGRSQNTKGDSRILFVHTSNSFSMRTSKNLTTTGNNSTRVSTPTGAKSVSLTTHERVKSHASKLDEFLESQGFRELFRAFKSSRKPVSNLYLYSLNKAYNEFLREESLGRCMTVDRFKSKIEAAEILFPEDRKALVRSTSKFQ